MVGSLLCYDQTSADCDSVFRYLEESVNSSPKSASEAPSAPSISSYSVLPMLFLVRGTLRSSTTHLTSHAEFQIPPQIARYASFMFSFIGRGVCMAHELLELSMA